MIGIYNIGTNGVILGVLLFGSQLVSTGKMTSGSLTSYILYTMTLQQSMATLSILQGELIKGISSGIYYIIKIK